MVLAWAVRPCIRFKRIQGAFSLKKQLLVGHPMRPEFCRLHSGLDADQQALKLRHEFLVLTTAALDGGLRRKTPAWSAPGGFACDSVMDRRVPDQVDMKDRAQIVTAFGLSLPGFQACGIQGLPDFTPRTILRGVELKQIPNVFNDFIPDLDSHALLGNGLEQSAEHGLAAISLLVACKVRGNSS